MKEEIKKKYEESKQFWNNSLVITEEEFAEVNQETDWKEIGSEGLLKLCDSLKNFHNVLDYGCGMGSIDTYLVKTVSDRLTGVDLSENAIASAKLYAKAFHVEDQTEFFAVNEDWLSKQEKDIFDNAICVNVVDVVPDEISMSIIEHLSRVVKRGGRVVIAMNPYLDEDYGKGSDRVSRDGSYIFVDGVLRMNSHTDEEWTNMLTKYLQIEKLEYFKWDEEPDGVKRRFFILKK